MDRETLFAVLAVSAGVLLALVVHQASSTAADQADSAPTWSADTDQTTSIIEDVAVSINPTTYIPAGVPDDVANANTVAFLDMLAWSEGTSGPNGYRMLFGGQLFDSYADHPRIYVPFRNTSSSAAGRYQILARTFDSLKGKLGLTDFSPESQDACALELIRERGALNDVRAGRISRAITKCAPVWASLPGAGYDQPERKLSALLQAYANAGGATEATA